MNHQFRKQFYSQDLLEVLEEWIILKLQDGDPLPVIDGMEIKVTSVAEV